jgi:drug/metabolite transporter (DMT)-like permease
VLWHNGVHSDEVGDVGQREADTAGFGARRELGFALVFLTTACFGCITTFSKFAYRDGSNPETLLLLRFVGFAGFAALLQWLRGRPLRLEPDMQRPILGMACFTLMMSGGYLIAAAFIPVGLAVVLLYTAPFLVALLAVLLGRERLTPLKAATMVVAFAGVVMAVGLDLGHLDARGIAAGLTAAAGLVLAITFGGVWMRRHDPLTINFFASLLLALPVGVYLLGSGRFHLPPSDLGRLAVVGATLFYLLGNLFWVFSMRLVPPIPMAVILNLETPITIAMGAAVLSERLGPGQLTGAGLVVAAIMSLTVLGRASS